MCHGDSLSVSRNTCPLLQVADAESAFLKQLNTVAQDAARVRALLDSVLPPDVSKWQLTHDCQQLLVHSLALARTLKQQKEVGGGGGVRAVCVFVCACCDGDTVCAALLAHLRVSPHHAPREVDAGTRPAAMHTGCVCAGGQLG
jgi:hypothetical protein